MGFCLLPTGELIIETQPICEDQGGVWFPGEFENIFEDWQSLGCTDFDANNYDETANVDDGSCEYGACHTAHDVERFGIWPGSSKICPGYRASFQFKPYNLPDVMSGDDAHLIGGDDYWPLGDDYWANEPWESQIDWENCYLVHIGYGNFPQHPEDTPFDSSRHFYDEIKINDDNSGMQKLFNMSGFKISDPDHETSTEMTLVSWESLLPDSFPDTVQTEYQKNHIALTICVYGNGGIHPAGTSLIDYGTQASVLPLEFRGFNEVDTGNHVLWDSMLDGTYCWLVHLKNTADFGEPFHLEWVVHRRNFQPFGPMNMTQEQMALSDPFLIGEEWNFLFGQDQWPPVSQWGIHHDSKSLAVAPQRKYWWTCWTDTGNDPPNQHTNHHRCWDYISFWTDGEFTCGHFYNESILAIINRSPYALSYDPSWIPHYTGWGQVKILEDSGRVSKFPSHSYSTSSAPSGQNVNMKQIAEISSEVSEGNSYRIHELDELSKSIMEEKK